MDQLLLRSWWMLALRGAAALLFGIFALAGVVSITFGTLVFLFPLAGALAMVFMVSFYATLSGVLLLALAFRARKWARRSGAADDFSPGYPRQPVT
jgi:uncharacterized membrane protein HdeD (DUF308 family)